MNFLAIVSPNLTGGPPVIALGCCGGGPLTVEEITRVVLRGSQTKMQSVERLTLKKYFRGKLEN